jgi:hypothetical protein
MARVFVSYRRDDSSGHTGRLQERLRAELGKRSVFVDVSNIDAGTDFEDAIAKAIGRSKTVLAVIGRDWFGEKDANGQSRLEDPSDHVRLELERAYTTGKTVIPILVRGADMPRVEDLPESLRKLASAQALELRDTRWDADVENVLRRVGGHPLFRRVWRNKWKVAPLLVALLGLAPAVLYLTQAPVEAAERFLTLLAQGNMRAAYESTAFVVRQGTTEEEFAAEMQRIGLHDNASASWSSRSISNDIARLSGRVSTKQRAVIPLEIVLVREGGDWRVARIELRLTEE